MHVRKCYAILVKVKVGLLGQRPIKDFDQIRQEQCIAILWEISLKICNSDILKELRLRLGTGCLHLLTGYLIFVQAYISKLHATHPRERLSLLIYTSPPYVVKAAVCLICFSSERNALALVEISHRPISILRQKQMLHSSVFE